MSKSHIGVCLFSAFLLSAAASAQSFEAKPGLWETTVTTQMNGMPPVDLSKLPPDQRERVEAAMKARGMSGGNGTPTVVKHCVTKEDLEKKLFSSPNEDASCKRTIVTRTSKSMDVKIDCANDKRKTTGTGRFEATTPETMKGSFQMTSSDGTRTMNVTVTITGKWLGNDCGDTK